MRLAQSVLAAAKVTLASVYIRLRDLRAANSGEALCREAAAIYAGANAPVLRALAGANRWAAQSRKSANCSSRCARSPGRQTARRIAWSQGYLINQSEVFQTTSRFPVRPATLKMEYAPHPASAETLARSRVILTTNGRS